MGALQERMKQEIVSHETFLRPFPVDRVMGVLQYYWEERGYHPGDEMYFEMFFDCMEMLYHFSSEKLRFGDMRYVIEAQLDCYSDEILIDVRVEKVNTKMVLLAGQHRLSQYNIEFVETQLINSEHMGAIALGDILDNMYIFFERVAETVEQWNKICRESKPIITHKPPFGEFMDTIDDAIYELAQEEWHHIGSEFEDWQHFITTHAFSSSMLIYYPFHLGEPHLKFGPFELSARLEILDGELNILTPIISVEGVLMDFIPAEAQWSSYYDFFTIEEYMTMMDDLCDEMMAAVIQWNNLL